MPQQTFSLSYLRFLKAMQEPMSCNTYRLPKRLELLSTEERQFITHGSHPYDWFRDMVKQKRLTCFGGTINDEFQHYDVVVAYVLSLFANNFGTTGNIEWDFLRMRDRYLMQAEEPRIYVNAAYEGLRYLCAVDENISFKSPLVTNVSMDYLNSRYQKTCVTPTPAYYMGDGMFVFDNRVDDDAAKYPAKWLIKHANLDLLGLVIIKVEDYETFNIIEGTCHE